MLSGGYANTVVDTMLSWLKSLADWVLRLFDLMGSGSSSPLLWLSENWLRLLFILVIAGTVADILVWLIRWRPHWVWFRKKRVIINDENFFAHEKLADYDLPDDALINDANWDAQPRKHKAKRTHEDARPAQKHRKAAQKAAAKPTAGKAQQHKKEEIDDLFNVQ